MDGRLVLFFWDSEAIELDRDLEDNSYNAESLSFVGIQDRQLTAAVTN
jgi:hypothetical protein